MLGKEGIHGGKEMGALFLRQLFDELKPVKCVFINVLVQAILDQIIQCYAKGISDPTGGFNGGFNLFSFILADDVPTGTYGLAQISLSHFFLSAGIGYLLSKKSYM